MIHASLKTGFMNEDQSQDICTNITNEPGTDHVQVIGPPRLDPSRQQLILASNANREADEIQRINQKMFDPNREAIKRDQSKLKRYISQLKDRLANKRTTLEQMAED